VWRFYRCLSEEIPEEALSILSAGQVNCEYINNVLLALNNLGVQFRHLVLCKIVSVSLTRALWYSEWRYPVHQRGSGLMLILL
jgi:hypothetical protein